MRLADRIWAPLFALALPIACVPAISMTSGNGGSDGGASASAGGSAPACTPGEARACSCPVTMGGAPPYPPGITGQQTCDAAGAGWLACACPPPLCAPLQTISCYEGPPGTEGVGRCRAGTRACLEDGSGYGLCRGQVLPRAELCGTTGDDDCDGAVLPCAEVNAWGKVYSFPGANIPPIGLARDASGDLLFATMDAAATKHVVVVLRLDPWGNEIGRIEPGIDLPARPIVPTTDGGFFVVGAENSFTSRLIVQRYDAEGGKRFEKSFPAGHAFPRGAAVDPSGNVFVSGQYNGFLDLGPNVVLPPADLTVLSTFLVKLDPSGKPLWARRVTPGAEGENIYINDVSTDAAGNVTLVGEGSPHGVFDIGAGPVPSPGGPGDVFVARLDPSGAPLWARRFGDDIQWDHVWGRSNAQGYVTLAGNAPGGIDFGGGLIGEEGSYVAVLDPAGNHVSSAGAGDVLINDFAVDPAGNFVIAGDLWGPPAGATSDQTPWTWDMLLARRSPAGELLAEQRFGATDTQQASFLVLDEAGAPYFSGLLCGIIDVGSGPISATAPPNCDSFVGKPAPF